MDRSLGAFSRAFHRGGRHGRLPYRFLPSVGQPPLLLMAAGAVNSDGSQIRVMTSRKEGESMCLSRWLRPTSPCPSLRTEALADPKQGFMGPQAPRLETVAVS